MDLNRTLYFVTVIECGSYTKAAQKLGVPKSTLSRHIQALENDLQLRLINRSTRKLSLTKAGESFFKDCQPLVTHLQNAHAHISQFHKTVTGQLRITMPTEIGTDFLNTVLPKFMEQHPKIYLDFDFSTENHNLIEAGYDLAIRIGKLEDSSYIARRIASPKLRLYASPNYLLTSGGIETIEEINQHKNIVLSPSKGWLALANSAPILREDYRLSSNSMTFNKMMCIEGLGIAMLPEVLCSQDVERGLLTPILTHTPLEQPNIYAVYPSRSHPSKALTTFIDFIADEMFKSAIMN